MSVERVSPYIEHLVELRKRIIIIAVAVVVGMGITWNFSDSILQFIEKPLTGQTYLNGIKEKAYLEVRYRAPAFYKYFKLEEDLNAPSQKRILNYSAPMEPFFMQCKIAMMSGFALVLPFIFLQLWLFIAPGLTSKERRMVVPFITVASIAFCIGALFFLIIIWPVIINFSLSYESAELQSWFNISAYVNFCLRLILIFGLIFELPVLTLLLSRFGILNYKILAPQRKYALLASSIIAAFHADLITMFVIMVPLYLMYEISIWVALAFGKKLKTVPGVPN
ncbi:twin-arginine translocase subunit TatC [Trichlorobacter lovleyi]|uniref:twin-arginine translocase subunit TatC n=1 Tax=Trichlorobacter lovleyi TaxID=313985 RepID=UPI00248049DF|nr:twin-arginine translocase subunit TatC [Trichlorobacter lovleyi]